MLLTVYVRLAKGGKSLTDLHHETRISMKTLIKAGTHGLPVCEEIAARISPATGGKVSVAELMNPRKHATPEQLAAFESADRKRARQRSRVRKAAA
jgi:hypothetical protein